jgi:ribonuclease-3
MRRLLQWLADRVRRQDPRRRYMAKIPWDTFQELLRYSIRDFALFSTALRHSSHESVERDSAESYERLEFLGDAVLDLIVARHLYQRYPGHSEGDLTKMRARLVNQKALAWCARQHKLGMYIALGPGEKKSGGHKKDSILSDCVEAVIGALYLDGGEPAAMRFIEHFILQDIDHLLNHEEHRNFKGELLEYCQRSLGTTPRYLLRHQEGMAHSKIYTMEVQINGEVLGTGSGCNKKEAEQHAAEEAIQALELTDEERS